MLSRTSYAVSAIGRRPLFHQSFSRSSRAVETVNQDDSPFPRRLARYTEEALLSTRNPEDPIEIRGKSYRLHESSVNAQKRKKAS